MRRRKKLLLSLSALLLSLLGVEVLCRLGVERRLLPVVEMPREGGWVKADPKVGFVLVPGDYDGTHINRLGLRGPEVDPQRKLGCTRILMLGGSTTYGNTVTTEQAYPAVVAQELATRFPDKCVEVINAGISGAHSYHQLARYRHLYSPLQPDVVTLYLGWNDYGNYLWMLDDWKPDTLEAQSLVIRLSPAQHFALRTSMTLRVIHSVYKTMQFQRNLRRVAETNDPESALARPTAALREHLEAITALARQGGASVLLIKFPFVLDDTRMREELEELSRLPVSPELRGMLPLVAFTPSIPTMVGKVYDELAKQPGVSTVDCATPFRNLPLSKRLGLFDDVIHLKAEGYRMLGSCVAEALAGSGSIPQ